MHLSMLSDCSVALPRRDAQRCRRNYQESVAREHFDGLIRGLVFVTVLLVPFALTFIPAVLGRLPLLLESFAARLERAP